MSGSAAFLTEAYTAVKAEDSHHLENSDNEDEKVAKEDEEAQGEEDDDDDDDADGEDYRASTSEKLFQICAHLKNLDGHPFVTFSELNEAIGVDLHLNDDILEKLKTNPRVLVDVLEEKLKFQPRFNIHDIPTLVEALENTPDGLSISEVLESGPQNFLPQVERAVALGLIIAIQNRGGSAGAKMVLFPRGPTFLVPLSGSFTKDANKPFLRTSVDVREEVRRGDCIVAGMEGSRALEDCDVEALERLCFRVSTEATVNSSLSDRLSRLPKPFSRSSLQDSKPPRHGEFKRKFVETKLPLDTCSDDLSNKFTEGKLYKHGCTNDLRSVWRTVCKKYTYRPSDASLVDRLLLENNLTSEAWISLASANGKVVRTFKKVKRRGGKRPTKLTNAHLD